MLSTGIESEPRSSRKPADTGTADAVDLAHLRRYTLGDVALEREVLQLFLHQLPQTIAALSDAVSDRDWMIAAHTLKGSCRAVGAWRVASLAENAERQMATASAALRRAVVTGIEDAAAEVRAFINQAHPDA